MKYILASASPRRKELLSKLDIDFDIIPAIGEETSPETEPEKLVVDLARQKGEEVVERISANKKSNPSNQPHTPVTIISADTLVSYNNQVMGKPTSEADAHQMLRTISGNTHQVYTGVYFIELDSDGTIIHKEGLCNQTDVSVYPLTDAEIDAYIATGEPMDKAGAYGIQGLFAKYVEKIQGDYNNVVGLPIAAIWNQYLKNRVIK